MPNMRITIHDVSITERTAEIPGECPGCNRDMTGNQALLEYALEDRGWVGGFVPSPFGRDPGAGSVEYSYLHRHGEAFYAVKILCAACGHPLACGTVTESRCDSQQGGHDGKASNTNNPEDQRTPARGG